jgi:hypothetical protein
VTPLEEQTTARFFANLQHVLVEGEFVSTYKYALLIALCRWALEHPLHEEAKPIDARELATHFTQLYWPQALPFRAPPDLAQVAEGELTYSSSEGSAGRILQQDRGGQDSRVLKLIRAAQGTHGHNFHYLPEKVRTELYKAVRSSISNMPLWKLQNVGRGQQLEFLYEQMERGSKIRFKPGVIRILARFSSLIEEIVRAAWIRFILRHNQDLVGVPASQLEAFLFPTTRGSLEPWRELLRDLQSNNCFYCGKRMGSSEVDHFLPWSRYPRDLGHNFVLAHPTCNANKSDHLASVPHLERWCLRNDELGASMSERFEAERLPHDLPTVRRVAHTLYEVTDGIGAPVWQEGKNLIDLDPAWRQLLASA